jgi:hypothetical protein
LLQQQWKVYTHFISSFMTAYLWLGLADKLVYKTGDTVLNSLTVANLMPGD